jgi:hypothetical protein
VSRVGGAEQLITVGEGADESVWCRLTFRLARGGLQLLAVFLLLVIRAGQHGPRVSKLLLLYAACILQSCIPASAVTSPRLGQTPYTTIDPLSLAHPLPPCVCCPAFLPSSDQNNTCAPNTPTERYRHGHACRNRAGEEHQRREFGSRTPPPAPCCD